MRSITEAARGRWGLGPKLNREDRTCPKHGIYAALSLVEDNWTNCPGCEEDARVREQAVASMESRRLATRALLRDAGIPARFMAASLESFAAESPAQKVVLSTAMHSAADFTEALAIGRCLAFVGPPGTGKTHLAVGILREVLAQGHSGLLTTVGDYVREIKDNCWGKEKPDTESNVIAKYRKPELLVLDEVGVQFGSRTEENLIFTLINKRYEDLKPTLVISNEHEDGLEKYLGDRTFDRLKDGGGEIVPFSWESYRG